MPNYRIRVTKTETRVFTVEETVEIPTDDPLKAAAYAEVAASFDRYDSKSLVRHAGWGVAASSETFSCEVLGVAPDFDEAPAPLPPVRLDWPAVADAEEPVAALAVDEEIAF